MELEVDDNGDSWSQRQIMLETGDTIQIMLETAGAREKEVILKIDAVKDR